MSRFQAKTNAVLDAELEELRRQLGLRANQKADLLRELTALASWVVHQATEGRSVVARGRGDERTLQHPVLERVRSRHAKVDTAIVRLELDEDETRTLAKLLDGGFEPRPDLLDCLRRLADPQRQPPVLTWSDAPG